MKEIWIDIKNFEGIYQVSNLGRVRSLARWIKCKDGKTIYRKGRILKPQPASGYRQVILSVNGEKKWFSVHRLVAETFIPNPDNLPEVNHKNEDKYDNRVENLEWCSHSYNMNYGTLKERIIKAKVATGTYKDYTGWKEEDIIEDKRKRYQRNSKDYNKKYREEHKEYFREYLKEYRKRKCS